MEILLLTLFAEKSLLLCRDLPFSLFLPLLCLESPPPGVKRRKRRRKWKKGAFEIGKEEEGKTEEEEQVP